MSVHTDALYGTRTPLERLELTLAQALTGGKSKIELDFREAYPVLERHLSQKMRKRAAMDRFNAAYKHDLNLAQFRKLLNAERDRRRVAGEELVCENCGQHLHVTVAAEPEGE
ncbi:hypothetical protein [Stenotrophomonas sp.]|uniref:hypothetical protein n=1 Tax=Stenotrophomonas sp. TaxID=69392 RepID=UPI0028AB09FA|nr:hypothetical protein [Stenotrophomonas sp.]